MLLVRIRKDQVFIVVGQTVINFYGTGDNHEEHREVKSKWRQGYDLRWGGRREEKEGELECETFISYAPTVTGLLCAKLSFKKYL